MAIDEGLRDVESRGGCGLRCSRIRPVGDEERVHGEDAEVIRDGLDEVEHGGIGGREGGRGVYGHEVGGGVASDVHASEIARGAAGGLEEGGEEGA